MEKAFNKYKISESYLHKALKQNQEKSSKSDILFVGDSIIEQFNLEKYFPNYNCLNRGIGGDTSLTLLSTVDFRVIDLKPKKVFIMVGTNDIGHRLNPSDTIRYYSFLISYLKYSLPRAKIYLSLITPVNHDYKNDKNNIIAVSIRTTARITRLNDFITDIGRKYDCPVIDTFSPLADDKKELLEKYSADGLHLSEEAYQVLAKIYQKYF